MSDARATPVKMALDPRLALRMFATGYYFWLQANGYQTTLSGTSFQVTTGGRPAKFAPPPVALTFPG